MRFLCYTMGDETVPIPPPSPELMAEMGKFVHGEARIRQVFGSDDDGHGFTAERQ